MPYPSHKLCPNSFDYMPVFIFPNEAIEQITVEPKSTHSPPCPLHWGEKSIARMKHVYKHLGVGINTSKYFKRQEAITQKCNLKAKRNQTL